MTWVIIAGSGHLKPLLCDNKVLSPTLDNVKQNNALRHYPSHMLWRCTPKHASGYYWLLVTKPPMAGQILSEITIAMVIKIDSRNHHNSYTNCFSYPPSTRIQTKFSFTLEKLYKIYKYDILEKKIVPIVLT